MSAEVSVKIPTILRTYTGGTADVTVDVEGAEGGATLAGVINQLEASYPGIGARILDEDGKLRRFVNIYVGDEDVRFSEGLDTATPGGSEISVIPAVAGG